MLKGVEYEHCEKMLAFLSKEDLISLKTTVTKNRIFTENVEETIEVILQYSDSGQQLLQRKKMKRDVLFHYLQKQGIYASPDAEKHALVQTVVEYWNSLQYSPASIQPGSVASSSETLSCQRLRPLTQAHNLGLNASTANILGAEFIEFFYDRLNTSVSLRDTASEFGPNYFSDDCQLNIRFSNVNTNQVTFEEYQGATLVHQKLQDLARDVNALFFKESFTTNCKGAAVEVTVLGELRNIVSNQKVAKFEQTFHLINLLETNSWIVANCDVIIRMQ